jgi:hypothetical protein
MNPGDRDIYFGKVYFLNNSNYNTNKEQPTDKIRK